jgi:nitrogen-specific signal transduction histidine kinase
MFRQLLHWRTLLALIAIMIVSGTIFYSSYLAKKIEKEEREKVEEWVEAAKSLLNPDNKETQLAFRITQSNTDIPIIETDEKDSITGNYQNIDSFKAATDKQYIREKLKDLKSENPPIVWIDPEDSTHINRYYYGHTILLDEVRYYPYVQLFIVGLFIVITLLALRSSYRSTQNGVWAGMAKETAHQLGTPVSSLEGWVEILKETHPEEQFVTELEKDVSRLRLVSDRFGKIGSTPQLQERNVIEQVENVKDYVAKRASGRVKIIMETHGVSNIPVQLSGPLFDWVIENLLKNALDAMEGRGAIIIDIFKQKNAVVIDVTDSGKGIQRKNVNKVFKPGFTTKKRGWGLGLSLSKRIIEQYHQGSIFVKSSEPGKGTTFRIILKN